MQQKNGMATAGLICGIISILLCWVPFAGLVLGVLGIVFGSIGMSRAGRLGGVGRGAGVTGLVTGILGFVLLPIMAAIAIPAFLEYMHESKLTEASLQLRSIETKVKVYYNERMELPPSAQMMPGDPAQCGLLPMRSERDWNADPGWRALGFHIDEPARYAYRWTKDSDTAGHAEALMDRDCDGVVSSTRVDFYVEQGNVSVIRSEPTPD